VRANIVKRGEDYIWSSAKAHLLKAEDDILSGESWLEENEVIAYREFLRQENQNIEDSIRKATSAGRPLGSEQFLKILEKILERDIFPRKAGRSRKKTS
jgi:putative transposase